MPPTPLPSQAGAEIPFDETHLHFGKGQTEASIPLTPGKHTLTLQFANALHKRRVRLIARIACAA
jgi:hypothetical protein